ncbi:hypothetical protein B0H13DRAFT_1908522 [Mycena leptocephala]|nr:hypothetical protein B0H13DRAFT_1908522 [Mycena leptocephala]
MDRVTLPPAILARIGKVPKKKTVLVYGHFDVRPAAKSDGTPSRSSTWRHGAGGPVLGGWSRMGARGELLEREKDGWFKGVDCVCIPSAIYEKLDYSIADVAQTRTPVLTYGLRGLVYLKLTVSGPGRDLHSGVFGRTVHETMTDLMSLISRLIDPARNILVPGVDDMLRAAAAEERAAEKKIITSGVEVSDSRYFIFLRTGADGLGSRRHPIEPVLRRARNEVVIENERVVMCVAGQIYSEPLRYLYNCLVTVDFSPFPAASTLPHIFNPAVLEPSSAASGSLHLSHLLTPTTMVGKAKGYVGDAGTPGFGSLT